MPKSTGFSDVRLRWFDDETDRTLQGTFHDVEIDNLAAARLSDGTYPKKTATVCLIRARIAPDNYDSVRVKPSNIDSLKIRFPDAWVHYEAQERGDELPPEPKQTLLSHKTLPAGVISALKLQGFDSMEKVAAMSDADAISVMGIRGLEYRQKVQRASDAPPAPPPRREKFMHSIEEGGFSSEDIAYLKARNYETLEKILCIEWSATNLDYFLGAEGSRIFLFAQAALNRLKQEENAAYQEFAATWIRDHARKTEPATPR